MEVKVAETAGFCYGVQRAVDAVLQAIADYPGRRIYTYGPIVHNETVVRALQQQGVRVIEDFAMLSAMAERGELSQAVIVIRAHGVGRDVTEFLREKAQTAQILDATCPFVQKIHRIVRDHAGRGERIAVTGTSSHPEVIGILGQIPDHAFVLETPEDAEKLSLPPGERLCLVSQTTFSVQKFQDIVAILKKKKYNTDVVNTICNATEMRQTEAARLSHECDAMIVIGGRNSSNTAKLVEICRSECKKTFFIQSSDDLDETLNSVRCVGITAGASTPKSIIEEVLNYVRNEF